MNAGSVGAGPVLWIGTAGAAAARADPGTPIAATAAQAIASEAASRSRDGIAADNLSSCG